MGVFYGLLPTVIVLFIAAAGFVLLFRRGSEGWSVPFGSVVLGYIATAMLVGVFLVAAGAALLTKAGFAEAGGRNFSYNVQPQPVYTQFPAAVPSAPGQPFVPSQPARIIDPSDAAIRDDVATGVSLVFAGGVFFAVHAFAAVALRRSEDRGARLIARGYSLIGLAVATLGFMGAGAQALNDVVRRYIVGGDAVQPWQLRHPGGTLSVAAVLLPLVLWFAWRVWQEMGGAAPRQHVADAVSAPQTAGGQI